jgi:hypothetical protein
MRAFSRQRRHDVRLSGERRSRLWRRRASPEPPQTAANAATGRPRHGRNVRLRRSHDGRPPLQPEHASASRRLRTGDPGGLARPCPASPPSAPGAFRGPVCFSGCDYFDKYRHRRSCPPAIAPVGATERARLAIEVAPRLTRREGRLDIVVAGRCFCGLLRAARPRTLARDGLADMPSAMMEKTVSSPSYLSATSCPWATRLIR